MTRWQIVARTIWVLGVGVFVVTLSVAILGPLGWTGQGTAFAQDDGGDDDGGDDDSGDDDGGEGSSEGEASGRGASDGVRRNTPVRSPGGTGPQNTAPVTVAAPPAAFARGEIVVTDLSETDLAQLLTEGFAVIERFDLVDVALVLHRLAIPDGLTLEEARDRVRAQPTGQNSDFNHFYRYEEGAYAPASGPQVHPTAMARADPCTHLNCAALELIAWPSDRDLAPECKVTVAVGVIDTAVNAKHENLAGADIELLRLVAEEIDPSQAVHGTAVASLLVGQLPERAPGLIREAKLIVVDIFGRENGDERASVASLLRALDLLADRGVKVINMSLAGPPNATLEAALNRVTAVDGVIVLAAAGNLGPAADVAYPAGYSSVIAVTAVDKRGQIYRRAQRGLHVDLAAPGVEVWSATSISGVKPKTGTSFAVPFATAVAAVLASQDPEARPDAIAAQLGTFVRDIGVAGPDDVFGAGLLHLDDLCQSKNAPALAE